MLSYIALHLTTFMRRYPLFDAKSTSQSSLTIPPNARLPGFEALSAPFGWDLGRLNIGVLIAIAASIATWFFLYRTTWGFEIRAVGSSAPASAAAGIDGGRTMIVALCVGGALAGLGGAVQLLGLYYRISTDSFVGLGFAGFFIALVARNNPLAVLPAALFFGALSAGGLNMQFSANVPIDVVQLAQGLIILVLATPAISVAFAWIRQKRKA
jgi:simple sugar transport system permease protein